MQYTYTQEIYILKEKKNSIYVITWPAVHLFFYVIGL